MSKKDEERAKCQVCFDEVAPEDALALSCGSSHVICGECSHTYADSVLQGGPSSFPPKCAVCRAPMPLANFERVLTAEQRTTFVNLLAMTSLEDGEGIVSCTQCGYFEIRTDHPDLFFCKAQDCGQGHCCTCKSTLPAIDEDEADDGFEDDSKQAEILRHLLCGALKEEKRAFDEALERGSSLPCPSCGVSGRKDGMCTHMSCVCGTVWCYVCGLTEGECDKGKLSAAADADSEARMYKHNEDFEFNEKRCPMYLNQLEQVDEAWGLEDDEADEADEEVFEEFCVSKLHRWRTLRLLKQVKDAMDESKWSELKKTFASVRNCGFSVPPSLPCVCVCVCVCACVCVCSLAIYVFIVHWCLFVYAKMLTRTVRFAAG